MATLGVLEVGSGRTERLNSGRRMVAGLSAHRRRPVLVRLCLAALRVSCGAADVSPQGSWAQILALRISSRPVRTLAAAPDRDLNESVAEVRQELHQPSCGLINFLSSLALGCRPHHASQAQERRDRESSKF